MVSLRGPGLVLLRLRGDLWVNGKPVRADKVALAKGHLVSLAKGLDLGVTALSSSPSELVLRLDDEPEVHLHHGTYSVVETGRGSISARSGVIHDALAFLWSDGTQWLFRAKGGKTEEAKPDEPWRLGEHLLTLTTTTSGRRPEDSKDNTLPNPQPLLIVMRQDTVSVQVLGAAAGPPAATPVVFSGQAANLLFALLLGGYEVPRDDLGERIWKRLEHDNRVSSLHKTIHLINKKTRDHGVLRTLMESRSKKVILHILPGDLVIDEE